LELVGNPPIGPFETELTLIPYRSDGEELPQRSFLVRGAVLADVNAEPSTVMFGARPLGEECKEVVAIESLTGQAVSVKKVLATGPGVSVEQREVTAQKVELLVKQRLIQAGSGEGRVEVILERQDGNTQTIVIRVDSCGLRP
jgi:hypothetical protein